MQDPRRIQQMANRRQQGLTYKELGNEFGHSPGHVHRLLNPATQTTDKIMDNNIKLSDKAADTSVRSI